MAGCAVQKARKVQRKITMQLSGWLRVGGDGSLYCYACTALWNIEPRFSSLVGRSRGVEQPALGGVALL